MSTIGTKGLARVVDSGQLVRVQRVGEEGQRLSFYARVKNYSDGVSSLLCYALVHFGLGDIREIESREPFCFMPVLRNDLITLCGVGSCSGYRVK